MNVIFRGKRIDTGEIVEGNYFKSPLTLETPNISPDKGWFFLSGEERHCIEKDHVVYVVDGNSVEVFYVKQAAMGRSEDDCIDWSKEIPPTPTPEDTLETTQEL